MQVGVRIAEDRGPGIRLLPDQVVHLHRGGGKRGRAERQAADRADVVLELRGDRALDRPVAAVVDTGCHLVEHRAVRAAEELHRDHPDIVQRLGDAAHQRARFLGLVGDDPCGRHDRLRENAVAVDVGGGIPEQYLPIFAAHGEDREFLLEGDEPFQDRRHAADRRPGAAQILGREDARLALAVIAEAARLQDGGGADRLDRGGQIVGAVDLDVGRRAAAERLDETLLVQPVLRRIERARVGQGGEIGQRARIDILELVGDHRDLGRKAGHGGGIVVAAAGPAIGNFGGRAAGAGGVDVAAIAEVGGGDRQHAAELAAAEDADRGARSDHDTAIIRGLRRPTRSGARATPPAARRAPDRRWRGSPRPAARR